ncbi:MAG: eukaryotic-like serine/threonine-protein kinase [Acidobacteriota bacterium]|nr:eukaryotic-like serine/threonine-protein kinase [Acidobacteriota bacterium]
MSAAGDLLRRLARPRLLTRVALALALVGLLPVAIAYFGLVDVNTDALYSQVQRTHIVAAEATADRVGTFLAARQALAAGAAGSPALADPRSPAAQELLGRDLSTWSELGVLAIAVVDERGEEAVRAQLKDPEARERVAAALAAVSGRAGDAPVLAVPGRSAPTLRFRAPLRQGGGAVLLVADGAPLAEAVRPVELGDAADLLLARRDGSVVAGSARSLDAFPRPMVTTALTGRVQGAGRFPGSGRQGELVVGAYAPVPGSDWVVLSRQPSRVAESIAHEMRRRAALAGGAALLLVLLVSGVAWASLVRPLRQVASAQRRLARVAPGATGDEIADLQSAFAALARSLEDRQSLANVFLGRYQVVEYLGTGAMGTVFRAWDPRLQRPVALKTVRLGVELAPEARRELISTLLHEAVTVARVSHGNVVSIYDVEDAPEGTYIAMEYVQGVSLERLLWRRGRLPAAEVIPLGANIARGLAVAHERGIVHRDVKPANVLLGIDGAIKVTDFGIADLLAGAAHPADSIFGTPGYVPPETLEGKGSSRSGDLFALGVVLYQCLTGVHPFAGRSVAETVKATLFSDYRPLSRLAPDVPAALDSLVRHLLERDPARRPADAGAVAAELERMAAEGHLRWRLEITPAAAAESPLSVLEEERRMAAQWIPTSRVLAIIPKEAKSVRA